MELLQRVVAAVVGVVGWDDCRGRGSIEKDSERSGVEIPKERWTDILDGLVGSNDRAVTAPRDGITSLRNHISFTSHSAQTQRRATGGALRGFEPR